jgi:hypothetical protein
VDKGRKVATVVQDQVQRLAAREGINGLLNAPLVFLFCFTLPGEHGNTGRSDTRGG